MNRARSFLGCNRFVYAFRLNILSTTGSEFGCQGEEKVDTLLSSLLTEILIWRELSQCDKPHLNPKLA